MLKISFKVQSLRKIPCPLGRDKDSEKPQLTYVAICKVKDLPDNIPMGTNPREQNLKTKVANKITQSLMKDSDLNFHLLNRGLLISADTVKFNNDTNILTLIFTNYEKHGDVDGGHTYQIILNNRDKLELDQYVKLEIMTGVEDFFETLAAARNTSIQVQDRSIAELEGKFQVIKDALQDEPFFNRIAYKENAEGEVEITDIVAILTMFNIDRFGDTNHPIIAYSSKKKCVDYYLEDVDKKNSAFYKMRHIAPDIFQLYSYIEERIPVVYTERAGDGNGRYGRVKGVTFKEGRLIHKLVFSSDEKMIAYESPKGFIYPMLAAFRVLVKEDEETGLYQWKNNINPTDYFDILGSEMVLTTVERSRSLGNNPQSVGKDSGHWSQMYRIVQTKYLMDIVTGM